MQRKCFHGTVAEKLYYSIQTKVVQIKLRNEITPMILLWQKGGEEINFMNTLDRMNAVIDYVECHLTEELDLKHLASLAYCSIHTFQRLFSYITDISIVEYIRRRRLSSAALELQQSNIKIVDLAIKYNYESPVSFARAFQVVHGITPSEARKSNVSLKMFPKLTFQIIIKGVSEMNYRIVKTESFKVFGLEGIVSTAENTQYYPHEGYIWAEFNNGKADSKYDKLQSDAGKGKLPFHDTMFVQDMCTIHGLMNYNQIDDTTYGYMLCSFVTPESKTDGYKIVEIPASTWAVFPYVKDTGKDAGEIWSELYQTFFEWLPASEFEKLDNPEFEMYGWANDHLTYELWIPVTKKT